jgi:hypothetical protein
MHRNCIVSGHCCCVRVVGRGSLCRHRSVVRRSCLCRHMRIVWRCGLRGRLGAVGFSSLRRWLRIVGRGCCCGLCRYRYIGSCRARGLSGWSSHFSRNGNSRGARRRLHNLGWGSIRHDWCLRSVCCSWGLGSSRDRVWGLNCGRADGGNLFG